MFRTPATRFVCVNLTVTTPPRLLTHSTVDSTLSRPPHGGSPLVQPLSVTEVVADQLDGALDIRLVNLVGRCGPLGRLARPPRQAQEQGQPAGVAFQLGPVRQQGVVNPRLSVVVDPLGPGLRGALREGQGL